MTKAVTSFKQAGTKSFRLSSAKLFGYFGIQAQNPDRNALSIFIPANAGRRFVQADQAGAEALCVANCCRYGNYRKLFEVGIKPHTYLALRLFHEQYKSIWPFAIPAAEYLRASVEDLPALAGWPELDRAIRKSGTPYDIGKRTVHARSYRMGPRTFQLNGLKQSEGTLNLTYHECKLFLDTFAALFPEVIEWQADIESQVRATRVLRNLQGFPREFNQVFTDGYVREAISFIPQSTIACITHQAVRMMQEMIEAKNLKWDILNNKHDSFLVECPAADVEVCGKIMKDLLTVTLPGRDGPWNMRAEVKAGSNWQDAGPNNAGGMKELDL